MQVGSHARPLRMHGGWRLVVDVPPPMSICWPEEDAKGAFQSCRRTACLWSQLRRIAQALAGLVYILPLQRQLRMLQFLVRSVFAGFLHACCV